mmetsp:Transcript_55637/g.156636  ORF Transcript_55637/g.156636 Transcript_55637/m.156636 type:complete len:398 (+) Transcript_55637:50-1243(+)
MQHSNKNWGGRPPRGESQRDYLLARGDHCNPVALQRGMSMDRLPDGLDAAALGDERRVEGVLGGQLPQRHAPGAQHVGPRAVQLHGPQDRGDAPQLGDPDPDGDVVARQRPQGVAAVLLDDGLAGVLVHRPQHGGDAPRVQRLCLALAVVEHDGHQCRAAVLLQGGGPHVRAHCLDDHFDAPELGDLALVHGVRAAEAHVLHEREVAQRLAALLLDARRGRLHEHGLNDERDAPPRRDGRLVRRAIRSLRRQGGTAGLLHAGLAGVRAHRLDHAPDRRHGRQGSGGLGGSGAAVGARRRRPRRPARWLRHRLLRVTGQAPGPPVPLGPLLLPLDGGHPLEELLHHVPEADVGDQVGVGQRQVRAGARPSSTRQPLLNECALVRVAVSTYDWVLHDAL